MKRNEFRESMVSLATDLIPTIGDEYRSHEEATEPSMQVTIGADAEGWSYQTGDNSYSGGAYSYATWAVTDLDRDTKPEAFADEVIDQLEEAFETEIFES